VDQEDHDDIDELVSVIQVRPLEYQAVMAVGKDRVANVVWFVRVHSPIFHQEIEIVKVQVERVPHVNRGTDLRRAISPDWSGCQIEAATIRGGGGLPEIDSESEQFVLRSRIGIVKHRLLDDRILQEIHHTSAARI
jgi:hypothetical protein